MTSLQTRNTSEAGCEVLITSSSLYFVLIVHGSTISTNHQYCCFAFSFIFFIRNACSGDYKEQSSVRHQPSVQRVIGPMSAVVGCARANSSLHRPADLLHTWKRHKLYELHKSLLRPGLMRKSAYLRCNISTQELCTNGSEVVFAPSSTTVLFFSLNFKSDCKRKEIVCVKMSTKTALSPSSFAFTSCFASAH